MTAPVKTKINGLEIVFIREAVLLIRLKILVKTSIKERDNVEDAKFYDIDGKKDDGVSQEEIDRILDKISQSGYENLTEKEKKILFEASKKMN